MEIKSTDIKEIDNLKKFLGDGLDNFNKKYSNNIIPFENKKTFGFEVYENGELIGGACGHTNMGNWVWVELLYVDEKHRGKDIGTLLIKKIENFCKENRCLGVHLNTWDWQAKGFYEKMGFDCYGELKNHPLGGACFYMKKQLL